MTTHALSEQAISELAEKLEDYVVDATDLDAAFIASLIKAYAVIPQTRVQVLNEAVDAIMTCARSRPFHPGSYSTAANIVRELMK